MADNMEVVISAIDEASEIFSSITASCEEMMSGITASADEASVSIDEIAPAAEEVESAISTIDSSGIDELGDGADNAKDDVDKLGDEADKTADEVEDLGNKSETSSATMQMAFQNIADGVMRAKVGVVELGRSLMETLELAGQQEQQETFLKMNIGAEGAAKQMKIINDLVADLPGDDVAIGGLLSQAAAKNAGITADELKRMGVNAADYFAAMSNYGKSSAEAQQDLTNYILTGNTAELERSPILQAHIDKLKQATTVEERNKALQEAMNEEGWAGISQQDTYNNKLETFTAMLDRGKRQMGEMFLDAAGGAMDFIGQLDEATGGVLGIGIAAGSVTAGPLIDLFTGVGQVATGVKALRDTYKDLAVMESIANAIEGEGAIAHIASALGITTEAAAAEGATVAFGGLAIAEGAALWPILAITGALALLGVAVYEVGQYFGWWSDVGSMLDAISAGVQRLWSAFINNPDVQAFLTAIGAAFNVVSGAVGNAVRWVSSFFNVSAPGNFDIVRLVIDAVGAAWNAMTLPIRAVITVIRTFLTIQELGRQAAQGFISNVINNIKNLPGRVGSYVTQTTSRIASGARAWATNAGRGAINTVNSVINQVQNLPNKVYNEFIKIGQRIRESVGAAVSAATSFGGDIVSAVLGALHIASPGIIQRKTVGEFEDTVTRIAGTARSAYNAGQSVGQSIVDGFDDVNRNSNSLNFNATGRFGTDLANGKEFDITTGQYVVEDSTININIGGKLSHEFLNLTGNINEAELARIIEESELSDRFIYKLVHSDLFQHLDNKVKVRLQSRVKRNGA